VIALLLAGCGGGPQGSADGGPGMAHEGHAAPAQPEAGEHAEHGQHHHESLTPTAAAEGSLYALDLDLVTATGADAELDLHRGHPVLITMIYTSCVDVCPTTIAVLKGIEQKLPADQRERLRIVLVSLDPARDTVEAMAGLVGRHDLDARWTVARVPEDQVRELSAALGVRYRHRPDGTIDHSAVVTLLDGEGVVKARMESLGQPTDSLIGALGAL
jgi:protein SCO1